ncbi:MAG: WYL domain-containing protein, partial [Anaerolineales bacterium]|nr:WYL domain-containing protein [Anaerolineales bacterium]
EPPAAALLAQVQAAIAQEQQLEICYQALGEAVPRMRRIAPYYLEQRGQLYYLHAYCYLAEEARVFRLDRVHPGRGAG